MLVVLGVGAFFVFGGDGDGGGGGGDAELAAAEPTGCPDAPSICITGLRADGASLVADFTTAGVELGVDARAVFFFTDDTASGVAWQTSDPFGEGGSGFTRSEAGARSLCALLVNASGQAVNGTGNCVEVPSSA